MMYYFGPILRAVGALLGTLNIVPLYVNIFKLLGLFTIFIAGLFMKSVEKHDFFKDEYVDLAIEYDWNRQEWFQGLIDFLNSILLTPATEICNSLGGGFFTNWAYWVFVASPITLPLGLAIACGVYNDEDY